jgi:enoyl-CoA hydratase/carnithine racemase
VTRAVAVAKQLAELPAGTFATVKQQLRGALLTELERIVAERDEPLLEGWLAADTAQAAARQLQGRG